MPHADTSFVPEEITTKVQFYAHVHEQLTYLLQGSSYWVSNLSQTSSLLYHSYLSTPLYGSTRSHTPIVNWVGWYLHLPSLPSSSSSSSRSSPTSNPTQPLLVGPYNGRPACISVNPIRGKGVCADAFVDGKGVVVGDVEVYPGHIACDGETKSEIVLPLRIPDPHRSGETIIAGVLDLDSTALRTFDDEDLEGLEEVVRILADATDWSRA